MGIAVFLVSVLGSLVDPIALAGYIAAGAMIRNYWGAICAGVAWRLFWHVALTIPENNASQSSTSSQVFVGAMVGAVVATSVAFLIARRYRSRKSRNVRDDNSERA